MAFDWNSPTMKKVKFVGLGLIGLVAIAFGYTDYGKATVTQSEQRLEELQAPVEVSGSTVEEQ